MTGSRLLIAHLKSLRTDSTLNSFFEKTVADSEGVTEEPELPRRRKRPRRHDNGAEPHQASPSRDRYRTSYYEAIDFAAGEVERRFDQGDLSLFQAL